MTEGPSVKRRTRSSPSPPTNATHEEQARIAQRMEVIGRLASGLAHDFNNFLTVILGQCHVLLQRLSDGDPSRKRIKEIESAGVRAQGLTRQLLAYSRQQVLKPQVLDLSAIVTSITPMLRGLIGEDIEVTPRLDPHLGLVEADPSQIEQVIMNLVANARDSMPNGGCVMLETANVDLDESFSRTRAPTQPGRYVMLAVSDTGVGMDQETQARIFEPFFTTKELGKGTGLGLATVYGIVKQSRGYIWVYSEPGKGSTFKIYLPRTAAGVPQEDASQTTESPPHGSETILVVDDERVVREPTREMLEMCGYTVLEARDGREALDIARRHGRCIHLLLTDVVMPKMSGSQLAERMASICPGIQVLYMSGYTVGVLAHHGVLDAGIAYLEKPFTADSLARKVRQALDARKGDGRRRTLGGA